MNFMENGTIKSVLKLTLNNQFISLQLLNTHKTSSLHKAFSPEEASKLLKSSIELEDL